MNFSVTKDGVPLDPSLYSWNVKTRTFTSAASFLVLDYSATEGCTFRVGENCTFRTGESCNFETGSNCFFNTLSKCNFITKNNCIFDTSEHCSFITGRKCAFKTGDKCSFETGVESVLINRHDFQIIDLSDYKKVKLLKDGSIDFDGTIMTYKEYQYLELVKNI
jgi:hypothetical protein